MRTLRLSLVGAIILALLGELSSAVMGRSEADSPGITQFTGTILEEHWHADNEEHWMEDDIAYSRGTVGEWTIEWTDPRLPSQMWQRIDYEEHLPGTPTSAIPYAVSVLLEDAEGSWVGEGRGMGYGEGFVQVVLTGEGANEGLYIILDRKDATLPDGTPQRTFDGFIIEGELTPMPDPVEPPEGTTTAELTVEEAPTVETTEEPAVDEATDEETGELSGTAAYISGLRTWQYWEGEDTIYEMDMSDPRANGTYTERIVTGDGYDGDSARPSLVGLVDVTLVNDEGNWSGLESGVWDDEMGWHLTAWLAGEGAYEGLALYLHAHRFPVYSTREMDFEGIIFEGTPPVMLEAVTVPAE